MLSVVIPVKNGGSDLKRCLQAIADQEIDEPVEIVVVDSASDDDSVAIAKSYGARVHEIAAHEFTHGGSRNLGASSARGDVLIFISQDAYATQRDWLTRLATPLRTDTKLAGVYGRQVAHEGATPPEVYFLDYLYGPRDRRQSLAGHSQISMDVTLFSNVNAAIRQSYWSEFPFAEDLVMSEDQEWSRRVLLSGAELLYESEAVVRHSHNYTLKAAFQRFFDSGVSSERAYMAKDSNSAGVLRRRSLGYGWGELRWLWRTGQSRWIPYAIVYETSKMLGLILGINHAKLPLWLATRLSAIPAGWRTNG